MAPPAPPLPKMEGLYVLMNASKIDPTNDNSNNINTLLDTPEKRKVYQESPSGKKIQKAENDCMQLQKQLELSQQAWRDLQELVKKNPILQTNNMVTEDEVRAKQQAIRVHAWQYKLCLANSLCPRQCQLYGNCWKFAKQTLGENNMRSMLQNRVLDTVCQPERDIVLRCVGREVASAVNSIASLESYSGGGGGIDYDDDNDSVWGIEDGSISSTTGF